MRLTSSILFALIVFISATPAHAFDFATQRAFRVELAAKNMTTLTESNGTGQAEFLLNLPTLTLSWTVSFGTLSSPPTEVTLHGPAQPGTNFPAMLDLAPRGIKSPLTGHAIVTEAQAQYLLQNWVYLLISTASHPNGEIRGTLVTVPPDSE